MDLSLTTTMLLSDRRPADYPDAFYIPGLSAGMVESGDLLRWVANASLLPFPRELPIAFNGSDGEQFSHNVNGDQDRPVGKSPGAGWPGKKWYIRELKRLKVDTSLMIPTGPGYHTRHELVQLVEQAKKYQWKRIGIVTVAWHYPAVFTMLVNTMEAADYWIAAYAFPPANTEWETPMKGSQGIEDSTPFSETRRYFAKLATYQDGGRACSFETLFLYLRNRETIATSNTWR